MTDVTAVVCPYCHQLVQLYVDPDTAGSFVEDCEICCRPWRVEVSRTADGELDVAVQRDQ
jgi:hypothetical protein